LWTSGVIAHIWLQSADDIWLTLEPGSGCASQRAYLLYVTHNQGTTWQLALAEPGACLVDQTKPLAATAFAYGRSGYAGALAPVDGAVYFFVMSPAGAFTQTQVSTSSGRAWSDKAGARAFGRSIDADFVSIAAGWIATDGGQVFNTTDGGASWACQL